MTVMSKLILLPALCGLLALNGCGDRESTANPEPETFECEVAFQIAPSLIADGTVDWTREAEFLQGPEVFKRLAFLLEANEEELREAVRFEFDVLEKRVRVVAAGESAEQVEAISEGFAQLYGELRKKAEVKLAQEYLTKLDVELEQERAELQKRKADFQRLLESYRRERSANQPNGGTLEQDRMTYQKALEALREDPDEGGDVSEDGVLFRKDKDE